MVDITVNGKLRQLSRGTTVAGLLAELALDATQVAVERNRKVVPRKSHGNVVLEQGDLVEVVTFVGGG